jgi:hypothetical protein
LTLLASKRFFETTEDPIWNKEKDMTDCSQLSAQLADALQQRSQLPQDIPAYCSDIADGDINLYKACLRSQNARRLELDLQIADLEHNITLCNALIGTWVITVPPSPSILEGQLTITAWDTDGLLIASLALSSGEGNIVMVSTFNAETDPQLHLVVSSTSFPVPSETVVYDGYLYPQFQPPILAGMISGILQNGSPPQWNAQKLS